MFAPGEAKEDWAILRAFSEVINRPLPYDSLEALRTRLERVNPVFGRVGFLPRFGANDLSAPGGDPAAVERRSLRPGLPGLLSNQPDQPSERRHGGMLAGLCARPGARGGSDDARLLCLRSRPGPHHSGRDARPPGAAPGLRWLFDGGGAQGSRRDAVAEGGRTSSGSGARCRLPPTR